MNPIETGGAVKLGARVRCVKCKFEWEPSISECTETGGFPCRKCERVGTVIIL